MVRCINRVCLPNIIADKDIVPEILMARVKPDIIAYEIEKLLYDKPYREQKIEDLGTVKEMLSDKISSKEAAAEICAFLKNS